MVTKAHNRPSDILSDANKDSLLRDSSGRHGSEILAATLERVRIEAECRQRALDLAETCC